MTKGQFLVEFPKLAKNYQPANKVLKQIENVILCIIVGPSGVGKSRLIEHSGFTFVPSDTTRQPRPGEQEGIDFYFRSDYEKVLADMKTGQFVQVAIGPGGDFYATRAASYPALGVAIMPIVADVIPIFRRLGFKHTITAFATPPSYEEWMRRMGTHHLSGKQLDRRLAEARRSFEFALNDKQTHFIFNDELPAATTQLKDLVSGKPDTGRENTARNTAESLLAQLP